MEKQTQLLKQTTQMPVAAVCHRTNAECQSKQLTQWPQRMYILFFFFVNYCAGVWLSSSLIDVLIVLDSTKYLAF